VLRLSRKNAPFELVDEELLVDVAAMFTVRYTVRASYGELTQMTFVTGLFPVCLGYSLKIV